MQGNISFQTGL